MHNYIYCSNNVVVIQPVPAMYWQEIGLALSSPYQKN